MEKKSEKIQKKAPAKKKHETERQKLGPRSNSVNFGDYLGRGPGTRAWVPPLGKTSKSLKSAVRVSKSGVCENRAPYTVLRLYKTPRRRSRAPPGGRYKRFDTPTAVGSTTCGGFSWLRQYRRACNFGLPRVGFLRLVRLFGMRPSCSANVW